ncbi:MAG: glycosyltransferase family 39 protein, partial [Candidatus Zixiibacteriota bacterium]
MMTGLDYRKNSQVIMRHDPMNLQEYLSGIRKMLANSGVNIIEDHRTGNYTWEIVGRSGKCWLTSSYLDKITVVDELAEPADASKALQRQFVVYSVSGETGSRAFLSIVVLCMMIIVTLSLKEKYLPRIFADVEPGRREEQDDDSFRPRPRRAWLNSAIFPRYAILIFGIALILRFLFLVAMLSQIGAEHIIDQYPDPIKYVTAADYLFGQSEAGQSELYIVGAGYPFFLAVFTTVFGHIYWPILVIQIILSCLSCVITFMITELLTGNRIIAVMAGVLSAVSLTSISLANAVLTETLFFFLLALSLYLLFRGLRENRWLTITSAGIFGGLTVLVRSAGMFLPLLFVAFALIFPLAGSAIRRNQLIAKSVVCALIIM